MGIVSLLGECHEPERRGTDDGLATPGCLWSTCGQGRRAEDRSVDPLRHARMPLMYLWTRSPCRRPVSRPPSPREDAPDVPVDKVAVPKTGQKTPFATLGCHGSTCGQGHRAEDRSKTLFATPGCLWSTCGQGCRAEDRSKTPFATPGCLWSTCGQGPRAEDRSDAPFATPGCLWSTCGQGPRADGSAAHPLRTSTGRIMLRPD